jgi:adenine-specific DNA-methyltransferase
MDIIRLNERTPTKVDLVTTFNFLLGIDIVRYRTAEHQHRTYHIIEGIKKKQAYLIIWRNFSDDLNLEEERDFIKQGVWFNEDVLIYSNADNAFGSYSIEAEFKRLMFEDVNFD